MPSSRDPSDVFPERLRQARELRQLSQAELAARARLQPSAVSHFETGTRRPSFDNLRRIADALEVSTDYLIGRSDSLSGSAGADVLYRDIERLSTQDRDFAATVVAQLAARNKKGGGSGSGS
jgi:transcriptional regulator with XRE-family HTH domain